MNDRQIGKIEVDEEFIRDHPGKIAEVFALLKLVPVRAELMFRNRSIEYYALSDQFDEIPEWEVVPGYKIEVEFDHKSWPIKATARRDKYTKDDRSETRVIRFKK